MEKGTLIILDGYHKNYLSSEKQQLKIVGILEPSTGVFKGIEVFDDECNIGDYDELLRYIYGKYQVQSGFSLVAGYYNGEMLRYQGMSETNDIFWGHFELNSSENRFSGKEKVLIDGRLSRNVQRPVNRYQVIVFNRLLGVKDMVEPTNQFDPLYELTEAILMKANNNGVWRGIQISVECLSSDWSYPVYTLASPSVKQ